MKAIPLTRARHASHFAIALEQKGAPAEMLLSRSNLPGDLMESVGGDSVISALSMLDFAENAATDSGILDLGFWAGSTPISGYGDFGAHIASAPSLCGAIQTFCGEVRGECSGADYYLIHDRSKAWFCHGQMDGAQQHELYALMIMVQVIRLFLGSEWRPARIRLQTNDEAGLYDNGFLLNTTIEFGAPVTAIEIPLKNFATSLIKRGEIPCSAKAPETGTSSVMLSSDPMIALQELISFYLQQSKQPSIELAAESVGVARARCKDSLTARRRHFPD